MSEWLSQPIDSDFVVIAILAFVVVRLLLAGAGR